MPIYQYLCGECGRQDDYLLKMGGEPDRCAHCPSTSLDRIMDGQTLNTPSRDSSSSSSGIENCERCPDCGGIPLKPGESVVIPIVFNPRNPANN